MEGSNEESDEAGRICGNESWFSELDYAAVIHSPSLSRFRGVSEAGVARRDPESRGGVTILGGHGEGLRRRRFCFWGGIYFLLTGYPLLPLGLLESLT